MILQKQQNNSCLLTSASMVTGIPVMELLKHLTVPENHTVYEIIAACYQYAEILLPLYTVGVRDDEMAHRINDLLLTHDAILLQSKGHAVAFDHKTKIVYDPNGFTTKDKGLFDGVLIHIDHKIK